MDRVIYMHRNKANGKAYIGLTTAGIIDRWRQHQYAAFSIDSEGEYKSQVKFHRAIRKYPDDVWEHIVLHEVADSEVLAELEVYYIAEYDTYTNGYNMTLGGEGTVGADPMKIRQGLIASRKNSVKCYHWSVSKQYYIVTIGYLGKQLSFGSYKLEEDAKTRADYVMSLSDDELLKEHETYKLDVQARRVGYTVDKHTGKYVVKLYVDGVGKAFGHYVSGSDAKLKVDWLRTLTNKEVLEEHKKFTSNQRHKAKGYSFEKSSGKYRVELTTKGEKHSCRCLTEQEAINKVNELRRLY